jgi:hypothetical protein
MKKSPVKKTGSFVWLRPYRGKVRPQSVSNGLKYHLWRSGPDAVRTLCGGMRALEDTVMLRPADSEQDAQTWSLCVRCRNLIPQEYRG